MMNRLGPENKLSPEALQKIGLAMLRATKKVHNVEGSHGALEVDQPNQYGETPILSDFLSEQAMINVLRKTRVRWHVESEEHGTFLTHPGQGHEAVAVLDGEDGSTAAKEFFLGSTDRLYTRFGPMAALAPVPDPTYSDFAFGGFYEVEYQDGQGPVEPIDTRDPNSVGRLIYATKGQGAYVITPQSIRSLHVERNDALVLGPETPGHYLEFSYFGADATAFEKNARELGIPLGKLLSTGAHFADLVTGAKMPPYAISQPDRAVRFEERAGELPSEAIVFVAETGRKGMEELAANYVIGTEAGVVFRTLIDGKPTDIGDLKFRSWSRNRFKNQSPQPIIAARSEQIAEQLLLAS